MLDLAICIVNWNAGPLLEKCVRSITEDTHEISLEVIVFDNASSDNSMDVVRKMALDDPRIRIMDSDINLGSAGFNVAIVHTYSRYVVIFNPDAYVYPGMLDAGVHFMDAHPNCGVMGPQLLNSDGTLQPSVGNAPTVAAMFWELTRLRRLFPTVPLFSALKRMDMDYDVQQQVEQPAGTCLFLRRTALEQVGLLDQRFFMYYEDVDWCLRFRKAGWEVWYVPSLQAVHYGGQSSIGNLNVRIVENARSRIIFFKKHYGGRLGAVLAIRAMLVVEVALKAARTIVKDTIRGKSPLASSGILSRYLEVMRIAVTPLRALDTDTRA